MKKSIIKVLLVFILTVTASVVKAGPGDGVDGVDGGNPDGDPDLPLDPGSWVLVAAGVGYGIKNG